MSNIRIRTYSPAGEKLEPQHGYYVDNDGVTCFGKIGEIDVTQRINASAKGSTLYEMIEKYQRMWYTNFAKQNRLVY